MRDKISIIGSGMMGAGIGAVSALAGHATVFYDVDHERTRAGIIACKQNIDQLVDGGLIDDDSAGAAKVLLTYRTDLQEAVQGSGTIIEAATENLDLKREIFKRLDELTPPDVIITSNTSGLRISDIVVDMKHPERTATTHFWYPAHLVLLVEVVLGERTDPAIGERLREMLNRWGKSPVIVKRDLPGQLANRILQAVIREAMYIVETGLASPEDVDTAIKAGMALRFPVWGPLEHIDGVGLDLALSVQKYVLKDICSSRTPSPLLSKLCEEKNLGYKTGKGIYDWNSKSMPQLAGCRDKFIMHTVKLLKELKDQGTCQ
jgi:3-hydroxybutyryl-CoA dehydrogenase